MIVLRSSYTAPLEEVNEHVDAHRAWLGNLVAEGIVIAAGRLDLDPPTGAGIIGAGLDAEGFLDRFAKEDPYCIAGVAKYEIVLTFTAGSANEVVKALDESA
jgi:uncharacterized protein YciI